MVSQIYGGGGNSGAVLTNDFIELFNPGISPVNLTGYSVQYASTKGSSWAATPLSGTIQPGAYYLVQEAAGSGGTTPLPAPDASGGIAMSASSGKVALVASTTALTGACPATAVDIVIFGTVASTSVCTYGPTGFNLNNTTAAVRGDNGCAYTGVASSDFASAAAAPRNSASTPRGSCPGVQQAGPLDHVTIAGANTVTVGTTTQLTATALDAGELTITTAQISWGSSDESVATVDATGKVTGIAPSATPVTITATAIDNGIAKTASVQLSVIRAAINWIDVSASTTSFPPGFQTQIFFTARISSGGTIIPANFTFEALDPSIATIAKVGNTAIVTGVAAPADGTTRPGFRITATPLDGATPPFSFVTHVIAIETPVSAPTSIYATNDEFGDPTSANSSNPSDLLITRPEYTLSYNESHGTPNWVSYELDARQMVAGQDRCNCFTADPNLPADKQIFTSDYTSGGFDRGHMTRSADRTAGNVDNATTFYLTNVVPQQADLNQGVWAQFENALADSARADRAVYIITGPLYSRANQLTFLKGEGKVAIPDSTWKVAFIGSRNGDTPFNRSSIQSWGDLAGTTVLAVNMPNVAGVRNDPWQKYLTTVDKIEAATGFDFLSLLPLTFQTAVEAGDHSPTARFALSGSTNEGSVLQFDASASTDPDLGRTDLDRTEALTYAWYFSDGASASGKNVSHTFANNGSYTANLLVSDAYGWQSTTTQTVTVANVAPVVAPLGNDTILVGETYHATGSFIDPGADTWTASADYGDQTSLQSLAVSGMSFQLSHAYSAAGTFTVTASVNDGDVTSSATGTVLVQSAAQGIANLAAAVAALGPPVGSLNKGEVISLQVTLNVAAKLVGRGHDAAPAGVLNAFTHEIEALERSRRLSQEDATPILDYARRVIASLGG